MSTAVPLDGEAVIVSGNGEDLGHAVALDVAAHGAHAIIVDAPSDARDRTVEAIRSAGGKVTVVDADLTDADSTTAAAREALSVAGSPRALVHTNAIFEMVSMSDLTPESFRREVDSCVQSAFILSHTVWPAMLEARSGSIVYVSSGSALAGFADEAAYVVAKHAQEGLMKVLALEGKPFDVAVNTMTTGAPIDGPLVYTYNDALKAIMVKPSVLAPAFTWAAGLTAGGATGQRLNAFQLSNAITAGGSR